MNKWAIGIVALALGLVVLIPGVVGMAGEAEPTTFHDKSESAFAEFSSVNGNTQTDVRIDVNDNFVHQVEENEPSMISSSSLGVTILQNDVGCIPGQVGCPPDTRRVNFFWGPLAADDFLAPAVSPGAKWTLNTTVNVFDFASGTSYDLLIDLTWTCTSRVEHRVDHPEPSESPSDEVDRSTTTFKDCSAEATGIVSDAGTNLTPDPSVAAGMSSTVGNEVEVSHP